MSTRTLQSEPDAEDLLAPTAGPLVFELEPAPRPDESAEDVPGNHEPVYDDVADSAPPAAAGAAAEPVVPTAKFRFHERHLKYLTDRAIDPELAWRETVRSLSEGEARQHSRCRGIVGTALGFFYGRVPEPYCRVQLDDREHNDGKTRSVPGMTPPPYVPDAVEEAGDAPLYIVEAPAKALSMISNGFTNAIALGGVNAGFFQPRSDEPQPLVMRLVRPSRPVFIVFDAGRRTNPLVAVAEARIARALLDRGCGVNVAELPLTAAGEDQGPDDYLAKHGPEGMRKLIEAAPPADPARWAQQIVSRGPLEARRALEHLPFVAALCLGGPGAVDGAAKALRAYCTKKEVTAARNALLSAVRAKRAQRLEPEERPSSSPGEQSQDDAPTHGSPLSRGDHVELAELYLKTLGTEIVHAEGATHVYVDGVWRRVRDEKQIARITKFAGRLVPSRDGKLVPLRLTNDACQGVLELTKALSFRDRFFGDAPRGLAFRDGFLVVRDGAVELVLHAPENRARFAYSFDSEPAPGCPEWVQFLNELWQGDADAAEKVLALQEFYGACLFGMAPRYKKCVVMLGNTDSGKSTCLDIVRATFPPGTTEAIAPGDWTNEYRRAALVGVLLNTIGELPEREWIHTESFKAFVGEDPINARPIYGAPFTYFCRAGHIFAANSLPKVNDRTDASWNRMIVIACNRRFYKLTEPGEPKAKSGLAQAIAAKETPGIVAWAVEGAKRLLRNGAYTIPSTSAAAVTRWKNASDQLVAFLFDHFELHPNGHLPTTAVYNTYRTWALATNHQGLSSVKFRELFPKILERFAGVSIPVHKSHGIMVFNGIVQKDEPAWTLEMRNVPNRYTVPDSAGADETLQASSSPPKGPQYSREESAEPLVGALVPLEPKDLVN